MLENMSEENAGINLQPNTTPKLKNPELLARMVLREGKPFKSSALACGYGTGIAGKGLDYLAARSRAVATAVERESALFATQLDKLKPLAVKRLYSEITDLRRPGGLKAIEIAGRFRETDWFVRNMDVQIGIFNALGEPSDPASDALSAYQDEPEN